MKCNRKSPDGIICNLHAAFQVGIILRPNHFLDYAIEVGLPLFVCLFHEQDASKEAILTEAHFKGLLKPLLKQYPEIVNDPPVREQSQVVLWDAKDETPEVSPNGATN